MLILKNKYFSAADEDSSNDDDAGKLQVWEVHTSKKRRMNELKFATK